MPIRYSLDPVQRHIHTRMIGDVTAEEVREHFDALYADPDLPERLDVLIDAVELGAIPTLAMIEMTRQMVQRGRERVRFDAVAVVAVNSAHYGMFRMGQVLLESIFGPTHVCRDLDSAREWLAEQRAARG